MAGGRLRAHRLVALIALVLLAALPARAQTLIRDAEIESALRRLAAPIATAAGLSATSLRVLILNDNSLNAFVVDNRTIFLHSGLVLKMTSAAQLQAVLAHEMAHIANGHITRRRANLRNTGSAAALGVLLSAAVAATGNTQAAGGVALGTSSTAQRLFFAHTRAEEASADQAALRYMARANIPPEAMVEVLNLFRGQEVLSAGRQDPYVRTHPLTRDRLRAVKGFAAGHDTAGTGRTTEEYWFARARGKLEAFLRSPSQTLRKVGKNDNSDIALMRRAVALHRKPDAKAALREIDRLLANRPQDAYVHELKGQILLESRNFGAAVNAYGRATALAPREALIAAGYGRALLALKTTNGNTRALQALTKARARDPYDPSMLRDLAVAYARAGQNGMASLVTAERYALNGRLKDAVVHAKRAAGLLPRGSAGWNRAQDVLAAAKAAQKRR